MFNTNKESKKSKIILIGIIILYFIIGICSVFKYGDANLLGNLKNFDNDDVKYIRSAWTLIDTGKFTYHDVNEPTCFIMPGLTFTLAFFMSIFGKIDGITAFRIFQVSLQALSIYILYIIIKKVSNKTIALVACVVDILYVAEYYSPTLILTETIFKFLLLLLVYISIQAVEKKRTSYYMLGGLVWGITCMIRPTIAAYPVVILVMWIIKKYKFQDMVKYAAVTLSIFCILMIPWWVRNYNVFGKFIPLTASSGNPFWQGTFINYERFGEKAPYIAKNTTIENDNLQMKAGLSRLKTNIPKNPIKYLYWYTFGKTWRLWSNPFYWKEMLGVSFFFAEIYHLLIVALGLCGIVLMFKNKDEKFMPLFLVILYFSIIYLPYYCMDRYVYPIIPYISAFSAYFIFWCYKKYLVYLS